MERQLAAVMIFQRFAQDDSIDRCQSEIAENRVFGPMSPEYSRPLKFRRIPATSFMICFCVMIVSVSFILG